MGIELEIWLEELMYTEYLYEELMLNLVKCDNPILYKQAEQIPKGEDCKVLSYLIRQLMIDNNGVGLTAPQVGISKQIITVKYLTTDITIINPLIVKTSKQVCNSTEGCLSFPSEQHKVKRFKRVIVEGYDIEWNKITIKANGTLATILQHEIDHLHGVTITKPISLNMFKKKI